MPGTIVLQLNPEMLKAVGPAVPLNAIMPMPILVEAGQAIGTLVDPGKEVPHQISSNVKWDMPGGMTLTEVCGEGIKVVSGDYPVLTATRNGVAIASENNIKVSGMYEVLGNVDKRSGNIETPTSVLVHGTVSQGAVIVSGGDVEVRGLIEEATVRAAGSIVAKGGVTGAGGAGTTKLTAGKDVYCQFAQQTVIEAVGSVVVDGSLMNSNVMCGKKLHVRKSGFLVGGKVMVRELVEVSRIGSEAAVVTEIDLGGNPFQMVQVQQAAETVKKLEEDLNLIRAGIRLSASQLGGMVAYMDSDPVTSLFKAAEVTKQEEGKLPDDKKELLEKYAGGIMSLMRKSEEYEVEKRNLASVSEGGGGFFDRTRLVVTKIAHPGTIIRMLDAMLRMDREYENAIFFYKKPTGGEKRAEVGVSYP
jgi:uncharacterized protein (DUF342 family)